MILLDRLSHKNKIFFASVAVILLVSVGIALVARWVLVSSLITRMEQRGVGIAQSVAEEIPTPLLRADEKALNRILFEASRLGNRESLISYMFVLDREGNVLGHTFPDGFPKGMFDTKQLKPDLGIEALSFGDKAAYDIAYPVKKGSEQIGVVHVGLSKGYIDEIVSRLRITFLGFISVIIIIFFGIAHWLSGYITRPMGELIQRAHDISRGNLDAGPVEGRERRVGKPSHSDEIEQLAEAFNHMTASIRASREQLKESEQKYRSLFDSGPNPVFVVDRKEFEILDANPAAAEIYGYALPELIGRPFADLGTFAYDHFENAAPDGGDMASACVLSYRERHHRKGNRPFYVNVRACPGIYQGREAIILATNDVTESMEKDAQLIQASKMKSLGEMSAGIAHELNQPLNAIKMGNDFLNLMLEKGRVIPPEKLAQVAKEVSAQVGRASEIITRLRDFARKADFSREQVYINDPILNVVKIFDQQLTLQNIHLKFFPGKGIPPVLASSNRLEQVLFNLLSNARDAIVLHRETVTGNVGNRISIRSFSREGKAVIAVSDTGAGISRDARDKIFEPFFTTKEVGKGMGLGLAIVYEIVVEHGGEIRIHSGTGIGTTFVIWLPHMNS